MSESPNAADYAQVARSSRSEGNCDHALQMMAAAVSIEPRNPRILRQADELLSECEFPSRQEGEFFGLTALRAYEVWKRGQVADALLLLLQVTRFRPEVSYLTWCEEGPLAMGDWTDLLRNVDVNELGPKLAAWMKETSEPLPEAARPNGQAILGLLRGLLALHPGHERLQLYEVLTLRKLERFEEAVEKARAFHADNPTWLTAITWANAERALGRLEEATRALEEARRLDPTQPTTTLDLGDVLLEREHFEAAMREYDRILVDDPQHPWALPSRAYAELRVTGSAEAKRRLEEAAESPRTRERACALLAALEK